ncbi:MAG: conjugal transfer protein TraS [Burkholderiaceae bacterium]|nr:conjugal transfer protein TraS [Burkholderiaceae bacterium]
MPNSHLVDAALVQWGDRLFYPGNRIVRSPASVLSGARLHDHARAIRQRLHATVVRGAPQVMVKVTGGGRGMAGIAAHLRYISKNGRLPIEDDRGVVQEGKDGVQALAEQWRHAGALIPERSARREAFNLVLSMPARTPASAVQSAARAFALAELSNHRYVMVLHTHQANPHVHLSVRTEGKDGQRLNPRKADLRRWRETFAEKLRELGIEAEASPQIIRGGCRRTERLWHRKARDDGRTFGPREGEQAPVKLTRSRRDAALAWCEIAKALASSDDLVDRRLGQSIVNYARWLPSVRYKPPEQQAQRELPDVGRGTPRAQSPEPARALPQRATPEPDRGR